MQPVCKRTARRVNTKMQSHKVSAYSDPFARPNVCRGDREIRHNHLCALRTLAPVSLNKGFWHMGNRTGGTGSLGKLKQGDKEDGVSEYAPSQKTCSTAAGDSPRVPAQPRQSSSALRLNG